MGSESFHHQLDFDRESNNITGAHLQKFKLYETRSNFYMIGWDKSKTLWKVLKIDKSNPSELNIIEDSTAYSKSECNDLLGRINEGNKSTGGLKFVTICYGIVGFIKFLRPYYMLLVTSRRKIGTICGHAVYAVTKTQMIPIPNSSVQSNMDYSKNENRYKKLLRSLDLTKGFFFSYSYHVMLSLQKNFSNHETRPPIYETLFVWNEYLTRGIRNQLKNTLWTVALVYGFFKQVKLSASGRDFKFTLIARRSRHYAGTRYLKRGVNVKGRVANDVETEQILFEDVPKGCPIQISSVVQMRGSIPLFWSQETSRLNIKPDIILSKKDHNYEATKLHFENLAERYGNPIIILNLIKAREKKPRESILLAEFAHAIEFINKNLTDKNRLRFLHWDLNKHSRNKAKNVLDSLSKVASNALDMTGFFYCHVIPCLRTEEWLNLSYYGNNHNGDSAEDLPDKDSGKMQNGGQLDSTCHGKPLMFQKGVLRTNCIDCLDRTNVAQYCYGLVALGRQLHALGLKDVPDVDLDSLLADALMKIYEAMGDTLAFQYGGSAAHNKIFSERRGQPKALTQSQEFFRTLQRYYSNAYMDAEKQDAINVFLGYFRPQQGKPALWELDSDQHYNIRKHGLDYFDETLWSTIKRSMSDGNIRSESDSPIGGANTEQNKYSHQPFIENTPSGNNSLSESSPEIPTCESVVSYSRYTLSMSRTRLFTDDIYFHEQGSTFNCSNFLNVDWLSSSGNSCEEETYERSALKGSFSAGHSSNSVANGILVETGASARQSASSIGRERTAADSSSTDAQNLNILTEFSESFVQWVTYGGLLFP